MPEPAGSGRRYVAGLDGIRALAVVGVLLYHLHVPGLSGGLIGVQVFFTLSGYVITDLLVSEWQRSKRHGLPTFWLRRARRLLPALALMLATVVGWVALMRPAELPSVSSGVLAASLYVSNWWVIAHHGSYFARFAPPSPLGNLWSLAIEEQFYLIWPWMVWAGLAWARGRPKRLKLLAAPTLVLAAASAVAMAVMYVPGTDPTRVYEGTDTRAFALLIGAALAMVVPMARRAHTARAGWVQDLAAVAGLGALAVLAWRVGQYSPFLYRGGMVIASVATAAVILAVVNPFSLLARVLGARPLRWLGVRSYGIYLWHFPVIVLTSSAYGHGFQPAQAAGQVVVVLVVAAVSWRFVEDPIRQARRLRVDWPALGSATALAGVATGAVMLPSGIVSARSISGGSFFSFRAPRLQHSTPPPTPGPSSTSPSFPREAVSATTTTTTAPAGGQQAVLPLHPGYAPPPPAQGTPPLGASAGPAAATAKPATSSCSSVAYLGDSTSESLISPAYITSPAQRLQAQLAQVGASVQQFAIYGGTSVVETLPGEPNAFQAASQIASHGFRGCWVLAIGTNDAADIAAGSPVGEASRIATMMRVVGNQPVLWVNTVSLLPATAGPYASQNMQAWNAGLLQACGRYPNMRILNWATMAQRQWFVPDGVHYNSTGSVNRAHAIAAGLAQAFPASPPATAPSGCLVG